MPAKTIFAIAAFLLFAVALSAPLAFVAADHGGEHPSSGNSDFQDLPKGPQSGSAVLETIDAITDWIFAILMVIAVIYLIMGAYQFVTGGGEPEKVNEARKKLLYAIIGIVLALAANGVDNVLGNIIG